MRHSIFLRDRYCVPVYGKNCEIPSLNFDVPVAWWREEEGGVQGPSPILPPLFGEIEAGRLAASDLNFQDALNEGGAAMTAYARLQFEGLDEEIRQAVVTGLLRYCELDTLAMVIAVQASQAEMQAGPP